MTTTTHTPKTKLNSKSYCLAEKYKGKFTGRYVYNLLNPTYTTDLVEATHSYREFAKSVKDHTSTEKGYTLKIMRISDLP